MAIDPAITRERLLKRAASHPVVLGILDQVVQATRERGVEPSKSAVFETGIAVGLTTRGALSVAEIFELRTARK